VQVADIEKMKREVHPMQAKKDLAARIVKDFHSAEAAGKAGEDWAKQFQKHEKPDVIDLVTVAVNKVLVSSGEPVSAKAPPLDVQVLPQDRGVESALVIRIDKLLAEAGLAESATEGGRKIKEGAVQIDGEIIAKPKLAVPIPPRPLVVRVGRSLKQVALT